MSLCAALLAFVVLVQLGRLKGFVVPSVQFSKKVDLPYIWIVEKVQPNAILRRPLPNINCFVRWHVVMRGTIASAASVRGSSVDLMGMSL